MGKGVCALQGHLSPHGTEAPSSERVDEALWTVRLYTHLWAEAGEKTDSGRPRVINADRAGASCEGRGRLLSETPNQIWACEYSDS